MFAILWKVWELLIGCCSTDALVSVTTPWLGIWFCLAMQPSTMPFDPNLIIEAKHSPKVMGLFENCEVRFCIAVVLNSELALLYELNAL